MQGVPRETRAVRQNGINLRRFELLSRSVLYRDQTILIIFMEGTVLFTAPGALSKPVVIRGVNSNFCY